MFFIFKNYIKSYKLPYKKTQNPRGNHFLENSKLVILDPQRMKMTNDHLFYVVNTLKMSKIHLGFIAKHDFKLTQVGTPDFHLRILVCKNMLKNQWKINKNIYLLKTQTCLTSPKNNIFLRIQNLKWGRWIWHENASNPGVRSDPGEGHQTTLISNMP